MASKKVVTAGLILGGALAFLAAQEAGSPKPLVRKDLLVFGRGEISPPARNIFRPKAAVGSAPVRRPGVPAAATPEPPRPEGLPAFSLNVSYIGSINAGGRTIGLVLRNGQTVSVGEGDVIAPGYRVVGIAAEAIVIQGPNSERRVFPRKGDRP